MVNKISRFASYKKALRRKLIVLGWDKDMALEYLNENRDYIRFLCNEDCPIYKAAEFINNLSKRPQDAQ